MRFDKLNYHSTRRSAVGFTLVEMLIVIVIIAIVAAIIFPVFKRVLESSREATSISNLKQIGQALSKYQLDHDGHSPPVLFGYADGSLVPFSPMKSEYGAAQNVNAATVAKDFPGLYPSYIKDVSVFVDPENKDDITDANTSTAVQTVPVNSLNATGTVVGTSNLSYYTADAYDTSPSVASKGTLNYGTYNAWYQTVWAPLGGGTLQLCVPSPTGSTYITLTSYHVDKSGNVLVLFQDGSVRKIDSGTFLAKGYGSNPSLMTPN